MPVNFKGIKTTRNRPYDDKMISRINDSLKNVPARQRSYILGTIIEESQGNPLAVDKTGKFQGLLQWDSNRYKIQSQDKEKELTRQLQKIHQINDTTDRTNWTYGGDSSGYKTFREPYYNYNNPSIPFDEGYRAFSFGYVRPAGKEKSVNNRVKVARQVYDRLMLGDLKPVTAPAEKNDATRVSRPTIVLPIHKKGYGGLMFGDGGYTVGEYAAAIYQNAKEEPYGDPSSHYNNVDEELLRTLTPDSRGHYDDAVKLPNHPSSPTRGKFNGRYFDLTDKGMTNPNYTLFGLIDNGDEGTTLRYNGAEVLPEVTVTPEGNYYDDTYNNIEIHKHDEGGSLDSPKQWDNLGTPVKPCGLSVYLCQSKQEEFLVSNAS